MASSDDCLPALGVGGRGGVTLLWRSVWRIHCSRGYPDGTSGDVCPMVGDADAAKGPVRQESYPPDDVALCWTLLPWLMICASESGGRGQREGMSERVGGWVRVWVNAWVCARVWLGSLSRPALEGKGGPG